MKYSEVRREKYEPKNTSKSTREAKGEQEREGKIAKRETVFRNPLVIEFIIQLCDFNFSLFLSKAGGAEKGMLVVCGITA